MTAVCPACRRDPILGTSGGGFTSKQATQNAQYAGRHCTPCLQRMKGQKIFSMARLVLSGNKNKKRPTISSRKEPTWRHRAGWAFASIPGYRTSSHRLKHYFERDCAVSLCKKVELPTSSRGYKNARPTMAAFLSGPDFPDRKKCGICMRMIRQE